MSDEAMVVTIVSAVISGVMATAITLYVNYRSEKMNDALITLYKKMCKASKIKVSEWNDSRIKNIFNVS